MMDAAEKGSAETTAAVDDSAGTSTVGPGEVAGAMPATATVVNEGSPAPLPEPPPPPRSTLPQETLPDEQPPVTWRELGSILLMVVLADFTLFHSYGFAGCAAFFVLAPAVLLAGSPRPALSRWLAVVWLLSLVLAARLIWCGSAIQVACGFFLLVAFSITLAGMRPFVLEVLVVASQSVYAAYEGLVSYRETAPRLSPVRGPSSWLNFGLPLAALLVFGTIFIVANPDLVNFLGQQIESLATQFRERFLELVPSWQEVLFWGVVIWLTIGLLRPVAGQLVAQMAASVEMPREDIEGSTADAPLYVAFRNTLVTVIALFAVYLAFEFRTLWFREFPEGFHYSGYAHEGAAWLTVALALATILLSLIFRGKVLQDARAPKLRRLAWCWSFENLLLAAAVYNRLLIYVGFNGMTWMRTVAFFGITCVVVGFLLVVWKIVRNRNFAWLVRYQLLALAAFIYLFALTPVDVLVHRYNVQRIMADDSAPSVQISVHPIATEAVPVLLPLVDCPDPIVREGVQAMLADKLDEARRRTDVNRRLGWTTYQGAYQVVLERLSQEQARWAGYNDVVKRRRALAAFHQYAYQWY